MSPKDYISLVASRGCVLCKQLGLPATPAAIHHPREGEGASQRASDWRLFDTEILPNYQDRVRAERADRAAELGRLGAFIDTQVYAGLPEAERARMSRQYSAMSALVAVLDERIAAFA